MKYSVEDVNHDGTLDLVFHFSTNDLIENLGDTELAGKEQHTLCLTGQIVTENQAVISIEVEGEDLCDDAWFFTKGQKSPKQK